MAPDVSALTGGMMPSLSSFFTVGNVTIIIIVSCFLGALILGGLFFFLWKKRYNKRFEIWKTISGRTVRVAVWKAWLRRIGTANDYWSQIWFRKEILPRPKKYIDSKTAMFLAREDGEFINFDLGDLDEMQKTMGVFFDQEDMRMWRVSQQKTSRDEHLKRKWYIEYGPVISLVIVIMVVIVTMVIFVYLQKGYLEQSAQQIATLNNYIDLAKGITESGSGAKPL